MKYPGISPKTTSAIPSGVADVVFSGFGVFGLNSKLEFGRLNHLAATVGEATCLPLM